MKLNRILVGGLCACALLVMGAWVWGQGPGSGNGLSVTPAKPNPTICWTYSWYGPTCLHMGCTCDLGCTFAYEPGTGYNKCEQMAIGQGQVLTVGGTACTQTGAERITCTKTPCAKYLDKVSVLSCVDHVVASGAECLACTAETGGWATLACVECLLQVGEAIQGCSNCDLYRCTMIDEDPTNVTTKDAVLSGVCSLYK